MPSPARLSSRRRSGRRCATASSATSPRARETVVTQGFRDVLAGLEAAGELRRIKKPVDPRHVSALAAQAKEATLFESVVGYPEWRVVGAVLSTRKRLAI